MVSVSIKDILQWCGITIDANKKRVIEDILPPPEGLKHLIHETSEEMQSTFRDYGRRTVADGKLILTRVQQKRLIALMDWVKDRSRLREDQSFAMMTTKGQFLKAIEEDSTRVIDRKNQKSLVNC